MAINIFALVGWFMKLKLCIVALGEGFEGLLQNFVHSSPCVHLLVRQCKF